jgi:hypothetical protein
MKMQVLLLLKVALSSDLIFFVAVFSLALVRADAGNVRTADPDGTQYCAKPRGGSGMRAGDAFVGYTVCDARNQGWSTHILACPRRPRLLAHDSLSGAP